MVTELAQAKSFTQEAFDDFHSQAPQASPPWLHQLRRNALARFLEAGFPTVKDEEWKYTNVAPLVKANLQVLPAAVSAKINEHDLPYGETAGNRVVFVNGSFNSELSGHISSKEKIAVLDLRTAAADPRFAELLREHLGREADYVTNSFVALNTAFVNGGALIYLPKAVQLESPLHLMFIVDREGGGKAMFPRVLIVADEGSGATIVESYNGISEPDYLTNAVVEVVLRDNSRLKHYRVQREGSQAFHVATTAAVLGRDSVYDSTAITVGAQLSRHDISVTLDAEGAECFVDGLYIVNSGQHADTHSVIDHRKPNCSSHQLYKGILDGKSRAVFNGKIFVRHDAQKTDAMQTNKNLLLSNEARVDTKPQLEILADDVKCAHGAAVGQIDEDELFYLETRGIHPELARNLLTYGFAEEVIEKIKLDPVKRELDEVVLNRLQARLEA
jgi:Fe-S cluster assembly protein SufD